MSEDPVQPAPGLEVCRYPAGAIEAGRDGDGYVVRIAPGTLPGQGNTQFVVRLEPGALPLSVGGSNRYLVRRKSGERPTEAAVRLAAIWAALTLRDGVAPASMDLEPELVEVSPELHAEASWYAAQVARRRRCAPPMVWWMAHDSAMGARYRAACVVGAGHGILLADDLRDAMLRWGVVEESIHLDRVERGVTRATEAEEERIVKAEAIAFLAVYAGEMAYRPALTIGRDPGAVLPIWGWLRASGLDAGHYGVIQVTQAATATFTVLEKQATYQATGGANNEYIGTTISGVEFVQMALRVTLGGTLSVNLRIDGGAGGTVWWDGVTVQRVAPAIAIGGYKADGSIDDNGNLYVPSAQDILVGTQGTPGSKTFTVRYPAALLVDQGGTATICPWLTNDGVPPNKTTWKIQDSHTGFGCVGSDNSQRSFTGLLFLPQGVTITAMRFAGGRVGANANDYAIMALYKDGTALLTLSQASGTGAGAVASGSIGGQLIGGEQYAIGFTLGVSAGTVGNPFFSYGAYFEIDYTRANLVKAY